MQLRPYQQGTKDRIIGSLRKGHRRILVHGATGMGKTVIAVNLIEGALAKGNRCWFVVDNIELIEQSVATLKAFGIDCGVIQGNHELTSYSKMVQVITAQTLTRRWTRFDRQPDLLPDLVIIDEAHVIYKAHHEIFNSLDIPVLGFTATPYTKGLGQLYDDLVVGSTTAKLTEDGYLVPVEAYGCKQADVSKVKNKANGDWREEPLAKAVTQITGDIVSNWLKRSEGRQTLVYCVNIAHSKEVAMAFSSAGVPTEQIDGHTPKNERAAIISRLKSGMTKVVTSVGTLVKGFDAPMVSCLVLARPTKSKMLHYQILGRGLRTFEGKDNCLIFDHTGNISRIGFPQDNQPEGLDAGEHGNTADRAPKEKKERGNCPVCDRVAVGITCACGHSFAPPSNVENIAGKLEKLTPAQQRNKSGTHEEKQEFYSGALQYAADKGKKVGYAAILYREKYGVWPNHYTKVKGPIIQAVITQATALNIKNRYSKGRRCK